MKVLLAFFAGLFLGPLIYPSVMALPWWVAPVCMGVGLLILVHSALVQPKER